MSNLVTRATKGAALTHNELDTNFKKAAQTKATAYSIVEGDNRDTIEYSGTGSEAFTLPDAAAIKAAADTGDFEVTIKHVGTGTLTIDRTTGADTIDGTAADITLETNDSVTLKANQAGSGWNTLANNIDVATKTYVNDASGVLISATTVADGASSVEFKELDNSYAYYTIEVSDLFPKTNGGALYMQLGHGGATPTYYGINEYYTLEQVFNSSGFTPTLNATDSLIMLSGQQEFNTNYDGWHGKIRLNGIGVTSKYVGVKSEINYVTLTSHTTARLVHNSYCNSNSNVITAVKLFTAATATTFSGGTVKLYGHS